MVVSAAMGLKSDKFKSGRLLENHAVETWNLGTVSEFS
jgi:hypothetical protein